MKKYIYILLSAIIVALTVSLVVVAVKNDDDATSYPQWEEPEKEYYLAIASYADMKEHTVVKGVTEVNSEYFKEYSIPSKKPQELNIAVGDVLNAGDIIDGDVLNEKLGKVEEISESGNNSIVKVSDFSRQVVNVDIPQLLANDVVIGTKVDVIYNNKSFSGEVTQKGYVINDGSLDVCVEIVENSKMFLNSNVDVKISIVKKANVLRIPIESLIRISGEDYNNESARYYVNVMKSYESKEIVRKTIVVGYICDGDAEVVSGIIEGDMVILYEQ